MAVLLIPHTALSQDLDSQFLQAARGGETEQVKALLDAGADVNVNLRGVTALIFASLNGHADTVEVLLANGAKVNAKFMGATALVLAATEGHIDTVRALLDQGADVNARTTEGVTALTVAARKGHSEIVELLKKAIVSTTLTSTETSPSASLEEPDESWQQSKDAGVAAYTRARYAEAEKFFLIALKEAENFGVQDTRLADSLNDLARLYKQQGKYGEAEPLYRRSLAIVEKVLGPEHPNTVRRQNISDRSAIFLRDGFQVIPLQS